MNTRVWQLQTAKNRFSEVVELARTEGPQIVTRRGREAVVVVEVDRYRELVGERRPARSFTEHLLSAPKLKGGLTTERRRDTGRKVDLE
jgi:prevent-host-death family protein